MMYHIQVAQRKSYAVKVWCGATRTSVCLIAPTPLFATIGGGETLLGEDQKILVPKNVISQLGFKPN